MFTHTLKVFLRDLVKNRTYNLINLLGLSIALASAFLILLFIIHEVNFDRFHKNKERIYRINTNFKWGVDQEAKIISSSALMKSYLINDFPEVEYVTRIFDGKYWGDGQLIKDKSDWFLEDKFKFVDKEFLEIFSYPILYGEKFGALDNINSLLISKRAAAKYFGDKNPIGKTVSVKNNQTIKDYTITAVFKDIPTNSTFKADFIASFDIIEPRYTNRGWNLSNFQQYILLKETSVINEVESKMNQFFSKLHPDAYYVYSLQNISDIYFKSGDIVWYSLPQGNKKTVILFTVISLLIILIASINYMILSTAKGVSRSLEIGMRKVIGASRWLIIKQILIETFLFILLVFPLALMVSEMLLPLINKLLDKQMEVIYFENLPYLFGLIGILVLVGLLSSSYISIYLSQFKPEDILKRKFTAKYGKSYLRKVLISIQLIVFVTLFIFSGVIILQIKYITKTDVGFNTEKILALVPPHRHEIKEYTKFTESIKYNPMIESVSQVASGLYTSTQAAQNISNPDDPEKEISSRFFSADFDFIKTFDFKLLVGRDFSPNNSSDFSKFIINETAVKELGLDVNKDMFISTGERTVEVIGVVKDFYISSLHSKIPPLVIGLKSDRNIVTQVVVKANSTKDFGELSKFCLNQWEENGTGGMLNYYFIEDKVSQLYDKDRKFGNTIVFFTFLTIIIAFLGLFGISLFISKQRNKEAGIHKTFGATLKNIYLLISKEFIVLVIISNLISWPIAYQLSTNWLMNYSYKIRFPFIIPITVFLISLIFILTVVGINAIRVANQNPTDILRYE